jgi:hypothetical protein
MQRKSFLKLLGLGAAICWSASAKAGVIVNDTWLDGTRTDPAAPTYSENGVDSDSDGNLESAWFRGGSGTLAPVGAGGPLRGTGFVGASASWTTYFTAEGGEVNLANVGDQLKVTWSFTLTGTNATNASRNLHIGLVDSPSANRVSSEASPGAAAYTGYALFYNVGQTLGATSQLLERTANPGGGFLSASGDWTSDATSGTSGNTGFVDGTLYTLVWTLTHNAANGLDISAVMSGGNLNGTGNITINFTDPTPNNNGTAASGFLFDTFGLRPTNDTTTASTFDTSLFKVEVIPEPGTMALFGLSSLGLLAKRRR